MSQEKEPVRDRFPAWGEGDEVTLRSDTYDAAMDRVEALEAEVDRLRRWKSEATVVIAAWEQSYQALEAAGIPARPGEFKSNHVLRWVMSAAAQYCDSHGWQKGAMVEARCGEQYGCTFRNHQHHDPADTGACYQPGRTPGTMRITLLSARFEFLATVDYSQDPATFGTPMQELHIRRETYDRAMAEIERLRGLVNRLEACADFALPLVEETER